MLNTEFPDWPSYSEEEADIVSGVLRSNRVNYHTGEAGKQFEKEFADWVNCQHAIALSNGTVALELALRSVGVKSGDEVIVTCRSFLASAACIVNVGATPVFADVELDSQNISARTIEPHVTERTKAIICVHLGGWPCEMEEIVRLARTKNVAVVEDCAQAHGATYQERSVGGLGDIAAWSFCQDKIMTTGGEGGMITTNNQDLFEAVWALKDHGQPFHVPSAQDSGFRYIRSSIGTNARMTEMQAALGLHQLTKMKEWTEARRQNATKLALACHKSGFLIPPSPPGHMQHAFYKFSPLVDLKKLKTDWSRDKVQLELIERGIPCYQGACPEIYLEKAFQAMDSVDCSRLPNAREIGDMSLMFLVHPTLEAQHIEKSCREILQIGKECVR